MHLQVTLHVSVWVEIRSNLAISSTETVTLHVSVWVEMPQKWGLQNSHQVTLHVSVWVEIRVYRPWWKKLRGHAPRERVSWNENYDAKFEQAIRSRSTWACELK